MTTATCGACGTELQPPATRWCERCRRLAGRVETRKHATSKAEARRAALKAAWRRELGRFDCAYSGVVLEESGDGPWSLVFDHATPADGSRLVACARIVNAMKTDLTEVEFKALVTQLAEVFRGTRASVDRDVLRARAG